MKSFYAVLLAFLVGISLAHAAPMAPVQGQVLETIDGGQYTYLRLKTKDGEIWAAVMHADVKKGAQVTIENAMVMHNFESKTLKRTFDQILFGSLAGAPAPQAGGQMPPYGMSGAAAQQAAGVQKSPEIAVANVPKATGPDARTVAEVYAQRAALKNTVVSVRGAVVKLVPNIMGKNWVHLRDGSGSAADGSNDLVVTTKAVAKPGDIVTAKGVVHIDVDVGMGMNYKLVIEDATLQK